MLNLICFKLSFSSNSINSPEFSNTTFLSVNLNLTFTFVNISKNFGSFFFKYVATLNPSTNVEKPPLTSFSIQCSNCIHGTGLRYGLTVCGERAREV